MIDPGYLETVFAVLRSRTDVPERLDPGLTDAEVDAIQQRFKFMSPPDLKAVLQFALPIGKAFPDWRNGSDEELWYRLTGPLDGIWFDVEHDGFWGPKWGPQPAEEKVRFKTVRKALESGPTLIPVYPSVHSCRAAGGRKPCVFGPPNGHHLLRQRSGRLFPAGVPRSAPGVGGSNSATDSILG